MHSENQESDADQSTLKLLIYYNMQMILFPNMNDN